MEQGIKQTMEARFVRCGDLIDGHEVIDAQRYLTAFVGGTVEFRFSDRPPLTVRLETEVEVIPASEFGPLV